MGRTLQGPGSSEKSTESFHTEKLKGDRLLLQCFIMAQFGQGKHKISIYAQILKKEKRIAQTNRQESRVYFKIMIKLASNYARYSQTLPRIK
jgi:hypothetical protein